jgi:hypothetical protein
LDLRFADNKTLGDAYAGGNPVTFTRASTGTFTGSDGLLRTAAVDAPRFDHVPITDEEYLYTEDNSILLYEDDTFIAVDSITSGACLGLMVEEARTNLLLQSEDLATTWTATRASVSINGIAAPNGTTTADKIIEDSTVSATHFVQQSASVTSGTTYTFSVYAKAAERSFMALALNGQFSAVVSAIFSLSDGSVGTTVGSPTTSAVFVGNGWWRVSISQAATSTGSTAPIVRVSSSSTTSSYTGDGISGVYVWGAQLEAGAFPTSYIPTTTATVTRAADVASITGSNFSSWYRQDEGTLYKTYSRQAISTTTYAAVVTETLSNSSANRIQFAITASNVPSYALVAATTLQGTLTPGGTAPNYATAYAYKLDDLACSSSGSTVATDTTAVMPTGVAYLNIGSSPAGNSGFLNGTIKRLTYWPTRLANTTLQQITRSCITYASPTNPPGLLLPLKLGSLSTTR